MNRIWKKIQVLLATVLMLNGLSACAFEFNILSGLTSNSIHSSNENSIGHSIGVETGDSADDSINDSTTDSSTQDVIETTELIETDATVKATKNGLQIYSASAYQAKIKGVFEMGENVAIEFGWIFDKADTMGNVVFRLTDVTDEENYVDIVFHNHTYNNVWTAETLETSGLADTYAVGDSRYRACATYVQWQDQVRSSNPSGSQIYNEIKTGYQAAYPMFTVDPMQAGQTGTLSLLWHTDLMGQQILTVASAGNNSGTRIQRIRARFDGTYDRTVENNGFTYDSATLSNSSWGLPYVVFPEGYTITILSEYDTPKRSTGVEVKHISVGGEYSLIELKGFARSVQAVKEGTTYVFTTLQPICIPSFYEKLVN